MKSKKRRTGLTILFSTVIFLIMLVSLVITAGSSMLLIHHGWMVSISEDYFVIAIIVSSSLIIGSILSLFVGKIALKPIYKIINSMNNLASGNYKVRLKFDNAIGRHHVVTDLTESFNKMASELENTEMLRADFINNFSHEFKTPIVSIAGFAKLLKEDSLSAEERKEYLDIIEEESMRLSYMATNVLNLTKVENQSILTDISEFNLSEQLRTCVLLFENKWNKKNCDLNLNFDECIISGNEELLKQVWINLIDNAVKYTPDFGTIEIVIRETEGFVFVSVINTGKEIDSKNYKRIFNKFFQEDESHSSEGNGVGLAIVKKIIELHNGDIEVESKGGKTKFTVMLPH